VGIRSGDPGNTPAQGVIYDGEFFGDDWGILTPGCRCRGSGRKVDCVIKTSSLERNKLYLVGVLKVLYSDILPFMNGMALHASSLVINGRAHIFTGSSGAGKSTISTILPGKLVADDFTPIFLSAEGPIALMSPFVTWEKRRYQQDQAFISTINNVLQSDIWAVKEFDTGVAVSRILENTISFSDAPHVKQALLDRAIDFSELVSVRELKFSLTPPSMERINGLFSGAA